MVIILAENFLSSTFSYVSDSSMQRAPGRLFVGWCTFHIRKHSSTSDLLMSNFNRSADRIWGSCSSKGFGTRLKLCAKYGLSPGFASGSPMYANSCPAVPWIVRSDQMSSSISCQFGAFLLPPIVMRLFQRICLAGKQSFLLRVCLIPFHAISPLSQSKRLCSYHSN